VTDPRRTAAVVLAAGAGLRYAVAGGARPPGGKLLAELDGRPLLARTLAAVRAAGLAETVVVLGGDAPDIEAAIDWSGERRVRNPHPEAGLSSSLRVGFAALGPGLEGAFVILGDQPLVDPAVLRALLATQTPAGVDFVAPRYVGGGGGNPVLVLRSGFAAVAAATGDRGLGPILAADPTRVATLDLGGDNPDVDTPADLAELAWGERVRRNRDQVDRHREVPDGPDFYGPVTSLFRADPRRLDEPILGALLARTRPDDRWLDIGAGAGRYALPLALRVAEVVAVEPSEGMRAALAELQQEHGIPNVRAIADRWPPDPAGPAAGIAADGGLIAHIGYDIEAIGPFLDAMEAATRRVCVAILMERQPSSVADPFWPPIHGEERVALPALPELVALLQARGTEPQVEPFDRPPRGFESLEELHGFVRRQLWLVAGGPKDRQLGELVAGRATERDGRWSLDTRPLATGLVTWTPRAAGGGR
jgi:molybdenum cofactor cytidylyltransferase